MLFDQTEERLEESFKSDYQSEYWSQHELYQEKGKREQEKMCLHHKLAAEGKKHDLVKDFVEKMELDIPEELNLFKGNRDTLHDSVQELSKMSVYQLKEVL